MHYNKSLWHFVLPAGLLRFILCLSSLSVLKCSCYVQSSASGLDQLLAGSLPLPSYTDTPLSLDQPPPVSVDGATLTGALRTTWAAIQPLVNADVRDHRSTSLLSPPHKKLPGLKICVIQFQSKKLIGFI